MNREPKDFDVEKKKGTLQFAFGLSGEQARNEGGASTQATIAVSVSLNDSLTEMVGISIEVLGCFLLLRRLTKMTVADTPAMRTAAPMAAAMMNVVVLVAAPPAAALAAPLTESGCDRSLPGPFAEEAGSG